MKRTAAGFFLFGALIALLCISVTASAQHRVFVMPDGIIGGNVNTAYALVNEPLTLFGDVRGGTPNYDWEWDADNNGTPDYAGTVGANDSLGRTRITANHTYTTGGLKIAVLTVRDNSGAGAPISASVQIRVLTVDTQPRHVNRAIHNGLHYLYRTQYSSGPWPGYYLANASLSALAFCNHGHRPPADNNDDGDGSDIYEATVIRALNYMFSRADYENISNQPPGNPDTHPLSGQGIRFSYNQYMYETGIVGLTIAGTQTPDRLVTNGPASGRTYKEVAGDLVDYLAYAQYDSGSRRGGWRYNPNQAPDNSVAQWPAIGLRALEEEPTFQVHAPSWVKTQLEQGWLVYSQNANGGYGYHYAGYWLNFAKTAAGVAEWVYALGPSFSTSHPRVANAINFLNSNWWNTSGSYRHFDHYYAMYALFKAAVDPEPDIDDFGTNGANWREQYDRWLTGDPSNPADYGDQHSSGYFNSVHNYGNNNTTTAWGLLMLARGIAEQLPVADAEAIPNPTPASTPFTLDGSGSKHEDPDRSLVKFEWDFDYDGITFDVDATGEIVTHPGLPDTGSDYSQTMALQVTDDSVPDPKTDRDTVTVDVRSGNVPPVSDPGGPYAAAIGEPITFDGTNSYDPNEGPPLNDFIEYYDWDLNANGIFGEAGETGPTPTWTYNAPGSFDIFLKVTDSFGATGTASTQKTTLAVAEVKITGYSFTPGTGYSVMFEGGTFYLNMLLKVHMQNVSATAGAYNITGDIFDKPPSHTVLDASPHCTWPDLPAGVEADCIDTLGLKINMGTNDPNNQDILWEIHYNSPDPGSPKTTVQNVPLSLP